MNISIQKAAARGAADYGWLKARYYFSFSHYHNPQQIHFGALRVLNDDIIAGGGGFYAYHFLCYPCRYLNCYFCSKWVHLAAGRTNRW